MRALLPPTTCPPRLRAAFALVLVAVLVYAVLHAAGDAAAGPRDWLSPALYAAIAALVAWRAVVAPTDRVAWAHLAAAVALYAAGSVAQAIGGSDDTLDVPLLAHAGWLGFYVLAYGAVVVLLRRRMPSLATTLALDGLIGALTIAAVAATLLLGLIDGVEGIAGRDAVIGIAYAGGDLLLLALVVWAAWLAGRAAARMWLLLAAGVGMVLAADLVVDLQAVTGGFEAASPWRALYPLGVLTMAAAAWQPPAPARRLRIDSLAVVAVPGVGVIVALLLLVVGDGAGVAHTLSVAVLAVAAARAVVTYRQLQRVKEGRRFLRGFEDAAIGMALSAEDGTVLRVNTSLALLLGTTPGALTGRPITDILHPDERRAALALGAAAIAGEAQSGFALRMLRTDGAVVETWCSTVHVDEDGDHPYLFSQIQDVTESNRARRHSAALAELGGLAIDVSDPELLIERAMPLVAGALGARSCTLAATADAPLSVPLRDQALVADLDGGDEVDLRFLQAVAGVLTSALDRAAAEAETRRRALHDPLTGLANRTFLTAHVEQELAAATRADGALAILLLDVDRFKMVNDTLGHTAGDELLCEVARRLRAQTRRADLVARLGGDEFVVACRDTSGAGLPEAERLAERIVAAFERPFLVAGREIVLGASIGVALADARATTADVLLRNADVAMYRAKDQGGSRHAVFDAALRAGVVQRLTLEGALRGVLDRGELALHYQPVVLLSDESILGFEALLRWEHPELGAVSPAEFIPIAEETGLIVPIGTWVLDEALRQLAAWQRERTSARPLHVGVNLSPVQLTPALPAIVADALTRHGVAAGDLILEITEHHLVEHGSAGEVLEALRGLGVHLALDDFGTGYSSLSYVSDYHVGGLKLDRSLVSRLGTSTRARGIVRGAVEMADALGILVLAEGIEERAQAEAARELGCLAGQGWLWSPALPAAEATRLALAGGALVSPAG